MSATAHWYVDDGAQVSGPFSVEKLQTLRDESAHDDLARLMVSKRGLDRWHPFHVLDELVAQVQDQDLPIMAQKKALEETLQDGLRELANLNAGIKPKVQPQHLGAVPIDAPRPKYEPLRYTKAAPAASSVAEQTSLTPRPIAEPVFSEAPDYVAPRINLPPVELNYVMLRGRLRLGELRNSFVCSFVLCVLTLGAYVPLWIRTVYRELNWNLHNDLSLTGLPRFWVLCLPIYHAVLFLKLARFVQLAEARSGQIRTKPWLAMIMGLLPPFGDLLLTEEAKRLLAPTNCDSIMSDVICQHKIR